MSDDLLPYYNQELEYFRQVAPEFARRHQALAGRLRMSDAEVDDPHVERLIQAVAFLNARTRRKLDDEFPEISQALLQVLYPQYLRPFPSVTIVRFGLPSDQAELVQGFFIPRGAGLATDLIEGEPYRFRTCYPVTVWPLQITGASIQRSPVSMPQTGWAGDVRSRIRLELTTLGGKVPVSALDFTQLRFFINAPPREAHQLYEAIFNDTLGLAVSGGGGGATVIPFDRAAIRPVGFARDEALVEAPPRSFPGYGLLTEYFIAPQKFLFFDVVGLDRDARSVPEGGSSITIDICCRRDLHSLERYVSTQTFQLGCCPVVNLFSQRAEPIRLTHHQSEYRIIPDARRPRAYEIHSVDEVVALSPTNETLPFSPFYSLTHHATWSGAAARFWHATRRAEGTSSADRTEMFLSLVDADFSPSADSEWTVDVLTTCLNPRQLPFGGGKPRFQLESGGPLDAIACLVPPTKTARPPRQSSLLWRLVSHLTLNHLSLVSPDANAEPLREILKLYDMTDSSETQSLIGALLSVQAEPAVGRPRGVSNSVCRGLDVRLHFDEDRFTGNGVYLFGAILERFLGLYCAINTFTRTTVTTNRREDVVCEWPARAGELVFL
jgi:type VI secretion system protein ImpG